jgi:hypothetical protein
MNKFVAGGFTIRDKLHHEITTCKYEEMTCEIIRSKAIKEYITREKAMEIAEYRTALAANQDSK